MPKAPVLCRHVMVRHAIDAIQRQEICECAQVVSGRPQNEMEHQSNETTLSGSEFTLALRENLPNDFIHVKVL